MSKPNPESVAPGRSPARRQPGEALCSSASASQTLMAPVCPAPPAPPEQPDLLQRLLSANSRLACEPPVHSCKVTVRIAFFFDGTGNNLDADEGTDEHSNVARLYKSHMGDSPEAGIYRFYIPGLGTYFRKIGDIGDDDGMAFGKYGDARLEQAMKWLDESLAKHPSNKIEGIRLALFGFSRGATLARAFARRVQARCDWDAQARKATLRGLGCPCEIYFLGLFDTVASVGMPASAGLGSLQVAKKWQTLDKVLDSRRRAGRAGLHNLVFGDAPGADPTPGLMDGHWSWARNLRIPPMVTRTVHLMAMTEFRNSFPLDTVWDGAQLPDGAQEFIYPGAHSNVGGGYRPGEAGKSESRELILSKIPLRKMYDEAVLEGVPLLPLDDPKVGNDFVLSPELAKRFNAILAAAGFNKGQLGNALLAHSELFFRWRFRKIRLRLREQEAQDIRQQEATFRQEAEGDPATGAPGLKARVAQLERDPARLQAERDMHDKKAAWLGACQLAPDMPHTQEEHAYEAAKARFEEANDPYLRERAKLRTLPEHNGEIIGNLDAYDRHLLKDVEHIQSLLKQGRKPLRPHYARLLQAYEDEFTHQKGLTDPLVIEFFDHFVHDSLAGFAKDETLPSDPRCCYIGGDDELRYADGSAVFGQKVA